MSTPALLKITTVSYGVAMIIVTAIVHYLAIPGIENCNSMSGIVSTYMSKDYSAGCQILSNIGTLAVAAEVAGVAVVIFGVLQKPKIR